VVLVTLALGGYFAWSQFSSPLPFYRDPAQLSFWYPLQTNLLDTTGHTSLLVNGTQDFQPPWGWKSDGVGLQVINSSLTLPYTFSAWVVPWAISDSVASGVLGSAPGTELINNNAIEIYSSELDVVQSGSLNYGDTAHAFAVNVSVHLVVSVNSTVFALYRNGTLAATSAAGGSRPAPTPNIPLVLGNDIGELPLTGQLSQARLFNRALSASEALTLFLADLPRTSGP